MNALSSSSPGIEATALAVSCDATAITGIVPPSPHTSSTSPLISPSTVPGCTTSGRIRSGTPTLRSIARSQSLAPSAYICVVEASVYSTAFAPLRK